MGDEGTAQDRGVLVIFPGYLVGEGGAENGPLRFGVTAEGQEAFLAVTQAARRFLPAGHQRILRLVTG